MDWAQAFLSPSNTAHRQYEVLRAYISRALKNEDIHRTPTAIAKFLKQQGFAKLPRRADNELPETVRPI